MTGQCYKYFRLENHEVNSVTPLYPIVSYKASLVNHVPKNYIVLTCGESYNIFKLTNYEASHVNTVPASFVIHVIHECYT